VLLLKHVCTSVVLRGTDSVNPPLLDCFERGRHFERSEKSLQPTVASEWWVVPARHLALLLPERQHQVMWRPSFAAAGVCFCLIVSLGMTGDGLAQGVPGYRMRLPAGSPFGGRIGGSARPPRPTSTTDGTLDPRGEPFGRRFLPYDNFGWYFLGPDGYGFADDSTGGAYAADSAAPSYATKSEPTVDVYPVHDSEPEVGPLEVSSRRVASGTIVTLTWRDRGLRAQQVAFFLADSAKAVLSAQTDRSPPFTATFQLPAGTAFAGMTVVLPGGNLVTRFLPYRQR
jgi:hypothetical protein